jgi:perosamine synthetase
MTNLQAALGVAQLEQLDKFILRKREIGKKYTALLKDIDTLQLPLSKTDYAENIYWVYGVMPETEKMTVDVVKRLAEQKIGTRPFFWGMHEQPVFQKMGLFKNENYPVAEAMARRGFYLPSGLGLTDDQIETVAEALKKIFKSE